MLLLALSEVSFASSHSFVLSLSHFSESFFVFSHTHTRHSNGLLMVRDKKLKSLLGSLLKRNHRAASMCLPYMLR